MFIFNQNKIHAVFTALLVVPIIAVSYTAHAQMGGGVFAYPNAGQSQAQTQKDQFECHNWSAQQTGFNPNREVDPRTRTYSYAQRSGAGEGSMIRGAAGGAAIGAIAGDAGKGAAAGAIFGGIRRASKKSEERRYNEQMQSQAAAQQQNDIARYDQARNGYQNAYSACMSARDYRVQ